MVIFQNNLNEKSLDSSLLVPSVLLKEGQSDGPTQKQHHPQHCVRFADDSSNQYYNDDGRVLEDCKAGWYSSQDFQMFRRNRKAMANFIQQRLRYIRKKGATDASDTRMVLIQSHLKQLHRHANNQVPFLCNDEVSASSSLGSQQDNALSVEEPLLELQQCVHILQEEQENDSNDDKDALLLDMFCGMESEWIVGAKRNARYVRQLLYEEFQDTQQDNVIDYIDSSSNSDNNSEDDSSSSFWGSFADLQQELFETSCRYTVGHAEWARLVGHISFQNRQDDGEDRHATQQLRSQDSNTTAGFAPRRSCTPSTTLSTRHQLATGRISSE